MPAKSCKYTFPLRNFQLIIPADHKNDRMKDNVLHIFMDLFACATYINLMIDLIPVEPSQPLA